MSIPVDHWKPGIIRLPVRVTPNAAKTGIDPWQHGADQIRVRLMVVPQDGAANQTLIALLSKTLKVPKRDVTIVRGLKSRSKLVAIALPEADAEAHIFTRLADAMAVPRALREQVFSHPGSE